MRHPFPDEKVFEGFRDGWKVESFGNENLRFHDWMNRREISSTGNRFFRILLKLTPHSVERPLRVFDREPFYRRIFVVTRQAEQGATVECQQPG